MGNPALTTTESSRDNAEKIDRVSNYQGLTLRRKERARSTISRRLGPIVTNLCNCAEGLTDMTPSQLRAALGLLNKVLPDAVADPANASGQTLAQILAEIARALPSGAQVGIAITGAQSEQPLTTPSPDSNIYVADTTAKDAGPYSKVPG